MQEELNNITKKATKTAKNMVNKVEETATDLSAAGVRQSVSGVTDLASDYLSNFNSSPLNFVRQYPVQAAIGGVILGFILGAAVAKKSVTE